MSESRATFLDLRPLSPHVSSVRLSAPSFEWVPGQYVELQLPSDLQRPYSIANEPNKDDVVELAAALTDGDDFSESLSSLSEGDAVGLSAPQGELHRGEAASVCYVATGTGLAPVRSMLRGNPNTRQQLIFGCRTEADVLWSEEHASWPTQVMVTLSRPSPDWSGAQGYVQAHLRKCLLGAAPFDEYIVCGSTAMVAAVREGLEQLAIDPSQIKSEGHG